MTLNVVKMILILWMMTWNTKQTSRRIKLLISTDPVLNRRIKGLFPLSPSSKQCIWLLVIEINNCQILILKYYFDEHDGRGTIYDVADIYSRKVVINLKLCVCAMSSKLDSIRFQILSCLI